MYTLHSETFVFPRENGERQRVQLVRPESWQSIDFFAPRPQPERAFDQICALFQKTLVPRYPYLYGNLVFFRVPEGLPIPGDPGSLDSDGRLALAADILRRGLSVWFRKPRFSTDAAKQLFNALSDAGCVRLISGKRLVTSILPVADTLGFLSDAAPDYTLVSNLSFFLMDPLDCATKHDFIGTPIGLRVKDGVIESPPQFGRAMLLVHSDGSVSVTPAYAPSPVTCSVNGHRLTDIKEHTRFPAPKSRGRTVLTIVNGRVAELSRAWRVPVPTSGFTAVFENEADAKTVQIGDQVAYSGLSDALFGVQVGPAVVVDGKPVMDVPEPFFYIKRIPGNLFFRRAPFPPALYPYNPKRNRAPRVVLGADADNRPMLLWFEGAAKHGHIPGDDSCGASLTEAAEICVRLGMVNGVHLDGGGSAQILLSGKRGLLISDRDPKTFLETERAVPNGLIIR